jgi:quercetin dioxygenase-like cupin family protein
MMQESPHFTEVQEQAALFALGALPIEEANSFQQRLDAKCPVCLNEASECLRTVDKLALAAPEVAPPTGLRARVLARIVAERPAGKLVRAGETEWEPATVPGVHIRRLHEGKTMLVRMAPKTTYPAHDHHEAEQCLVLEGDVSSEGITAVAGDYIYMPAGSSHAPLHSENGCVFLIAYT